MQLFFREQNLSRIGKLKVATRPKFVSRRTKRTRYLKAISLHDRRRLSVIPRLRTLAHMSEIPRIEVAHDGNDGLEEIPLSNMIAKCLVSSNPKFWLIYIQL